MLVLEDDAEKLCLPGRCGERERGAMVARQSYRRGIEGYFY